jgi:hypothetical protein
MAMPACGASVPVENEPMNPFVRRFVAGLVMLSVIGCGEPDVRTYDAPKPQPAPGDFGYRILGAMIPADEPVWFFKMTGTAEELAANEAAFDAFMATVTFPNGVEKDPKWTLPEGVKEGPPREMRFATLIFGGEKPIELSVSQAKGGMIDNLKRWAGQVGTNEITNATKPITVGGIAGVKVSLSGRKNPSAGGMMGRR